MILGHWVKSQAQLLHSLYKALWAQYRLQFKSNYNQTSHVGCVPYNEGRNPIDFRSRSILPPCKGMPRFALSSLSVCQVVTLSCTVNMAIFAMG